MEVWLAFSIKKLTHLHRTYTASTLGGLLGCLYTPPYLQVPAAWIDFATQPRVRRRMPYHIVW